MIRAFFRNPKWAAWAYGGGAVLFLLIYMQVQMSVMINGWYGEFYDLIQTAATQATNVAAGQTIPAGDLRTLDEFWALIFLPRFDPFTFLGIITLPMPATFLWIAVPYALVATISSYLSRLYGLRWREAITQDYIPRWRSVEHEIEGASQRIQEDTNRFARLIESLGLAIFRAVMTLIAFIPILWGLSSKVDLPILRDIPGSLVWASFIITIGGMVISWFVGYFLPGLEYNNQRVEAAFRKELVYGEDDKINHAQPETLFSLFTNIKFNYHRLYLHYGYFDVWSNLYSQVTSIAPLLMIGPGIFTGAVTFGIYQQVSNAYNQVDGSFALVLNNWTTLTELRSIWKRLHEFEANLDRYNMGRDVGTALPEPGPAQ